MSSGYLNIETIIGYTYQPHVIFPLALLSKGKPRPLTLSSHKLLVLQGASISIVTVGSARNKGYILFENGIWESRGEYSSQNGCQWAGSADRGR